MMWCSTLLVVLSFTCTIFAEDKPAGWPTCKRYDPNLNGCLLAATESMREILTTKGAKEFGLPTFSKFVVPSVKIQQDINPNFTVDWTSTDIAIEGFETYKFSEFTFNPTTLKWTAKVQFDYVNFKGRIDFNGKLFGKDVKEFAHGTISIYKPKAEYFMDGTLITKNGKEYYHIESTVAKIDIDPKKARLKDVTAFSLGIFTTISQILKAAEEGEDAKSILKASEEVVSGIIKSLFGNIPEQIPYDQLFPKE